jgi:hypothetical protein
MSTKGIVLAVALTAIGCAAEGSGTGGRAVLYEVALEPPAYMADSGHFETASGWDVELSEAVVAIGPFYIYENSSQSQARSEEEFDLWSFASELVLPTAHAHPGDVWFDGGILRGEYLGQFAFDLLDGQAVSLGTARGIAGEVGSVTVILDPPDASTLGATEALYGHHAWVVGTATKDGVTIEFEGGIDLEADGVVRQVDGVTLDELLDDDGTVVIGVHPRKWFDEAQFDTLTEVAESGRMLITPNDQVAIAWRLGLRSPLGYWARWTDDEVFPRLADLQDEP